MTARWGVHQVILAQVRSSEGAVPYIGSRNTRMPGAPDGAPRDIEEEVTAHRTLPREDGRHAGGIIRDQDVLMEQVAVDEIPTLRACGQELFDPRFAGSE